MIDEIEERERKEFLEWYENVTSYTGEEVRNMRKFAQDSFKSRAIRIALNVEENNRILTALKSKMRCA